MKKSAVLFLCAFSLFGLVRCAPAPESANNQIESAELLKPAQLGVETLERQPAEPGESTVKVRLKGEHWNSCIRYLATEVKNLDGVVKIQILDKTPTDLNCATVITPYELLADLGRLAPGEHRVQIQSGDQIEELILPIE